jgi:hypothetical protein
MKGKKYIFIDLLVRHGEYEFNCQSVHEVGSKADKDKWATRYAKNFYNTSGDNKPDVFDNDPGTFYFNCMDVAVQVDDYKEITKEEYNILKRFL